LSILIIPFIKIPCHTEDFDTLININAKIKKFSTFSDGRWMLEEKTLLKIFVYVILRESQSDEPKDIITKFKEN
jgi:hypothetical protein